MLKTPLCDLLGIEKPVFQGGMAWIADTIWRRLSPRPGALASSGLPTLRLPGCGSRSTRSGS